jgi:DNA-binding response OmpR family regulator
MKKVQPSSSLPSHSLKEFEGRILIVTDEPAIIPSFVPALEEYGFIVDIFDDPLTALSNFKNGIYDILIINIRLPKMNGFELYDKMKAIDDKIKICLVTAYEVNYRVFYSETN